MSLRRLARPALVAVLALFACTGDVAVAQAPAFDQLSPYQPEQRVSGTIRIWGHGSFKSDFMGRVMTAWAAGFAKYQPDAKLENHLYGTASAIGALAVGQADIALLGEEISPAAAAAFERAKHYPPLGIDVATGSLDVAYFDYAHVVFVHKDNPISRLTVPQLDAIFGAEHRRGPRTIRAWGELGVTGAWSDRRIQPYGWRDLDFSLFIQNVVLGGSHRWNNDLRDFSHIRRADGSTYDAGQQILDALADDRFGIAISNLRYANPQVKPIALAAADGAPYYEATKENLIAQSYPLTRIIPAFVDRQPGRPVDPKVREFLRYILSRDGQQDLTRETAYLQLSPAAVRAQLAKLGPAGEAAVPPTVSTQTASGTVRVWSSAPMAGVVARWQDGFRNRHPGARIEARTTGSDVAMAGLYTGQADVALLGREPTASEIQAFEWVFRVKPARVEIMTGSLGAPEKSPALAVFVHRDNPLSKLTLAQLDAAFGYEQQRGRRNVRTWGQLGLGGDWTDRPIDLYAPDVTSGTGRFFRHVVMNDRRNLNWDHLREFTDQNTIVDALAHDRFGLAVAPLGFARPDVKALALAVDGAMPAVHATPASVASRSYPLARTAFALVRRLPSRPEPAVEEFLRYVLSAEGQAEVARDGSYFPLPATTYAQHLVDDIAAANPDLLAVAVRITAPKSAENVTVAASHGKHGGSEERFPVGFALKDTLGTNVGALELAFPYRTGAGTASLQQRAERIRDDVARHILNEANLWDPYPLDPAAPANTRAQRLVDRTMAKHPELLSLALHVTLPAGNDNIILASSFGRIGKKADDDDRKVLDTGKTTPGIYGGGKRYGVELALRDARGATIGALSVAYAYKAGEEAALLDRAERVRDELREQFASVEQLLETGYTPAQYDLSALPSYTPKRQALGVLRVYGTPLEALVGRWATEFRARQGHVRLHSYLINTSQAFAGLVTGQADVGLMGHRTWHTPLKAFDATFGYAPLEIRFATGSYDDPEGTTPGLMFIVNKHNPLANLTLEQIDGIFGAQRTGGWAGTAWSTAAARGPEGNLRTWDQLGLGGAWAGQPIHPRGTDVTLSNWADLIEREAFHGGTKWNPALYEGPRADISWKAHGKTRDQQIVEGVQNDPLAIGFTFQRVLDATKADVNVLPLAVRSGAPFVAPSAQSFFDGSYPMHNGAYLYLNRVPGHRLPARTEEFVRFVLSREGQRIVAESRLFVPLNEAQAQAELKKLEP